LIIHTHWNLILFSLKKQDIGVEKNQLIAAQLINDMPVIFPFESASFLGFKKESGYGDFRLSGVTITPAMDTVHLARFNFSC